MPRTSASFSPNPALRMASGQAVAGSPSLSTLTSPFDHDANPAAWQGLARLIDTLDRYLRLPSTPRAFMLYLAGLILVFTGALLHVTVAAQVMAAKIELADLNRQYALIEQQNGDLIFRISRHSNVMRLQEQAAGLGYVPATEREYIFVPSESAPAMAAAPTPSTAQPAPVVTTPSTTPVTERSGQAPWRAWSEYLGLPVRVPSGHDWAQARPADTRGDSARPDLLSELGKQLERLGIR